MKLMITLAAVALLAGCAKQTFDINDGKSVLTRENMDVFFISGLGQEKRLNAARVCGGADRVVKVEVQQDFLDGLIGGLTGGIVTPRQARVYCRS